jgi:hypothetical protein
VVPLTTTTNTVAGNLFFNSSLLAGVLELDLEIDLELLRDQVHNSSWISN